MSKKNLAKSHPPLLIPHYAVTDGGSGSVRMNLYAVVDGGLVKMPDVEDLRSNCKLGQGIAGPNPTLRRENLAAATGAFKVFNATLIKHGIPQERICTVMTGAIAAVEETKQGDEDIAEINKNYGNRRFFILRDEEEAILNGLIAKIPSTKFFRNKNNELKHKPSRKLVASIGGATLQLCFVEASGEITHPVRILLGIHPLKELSAGKITKAGKILKKSLNKHFRNPPRIKCMVAAGGMWRAHGEITGKGNLPTKLHGASIRKTLLSRTHRKPSYFNKLLLQRKTRLLNKKVDLAPHKLSKILERTENMALAAAMLRVIASHFSVNTIYFSPYTIRDAAVYQMHGLATGELSSPERGLERLFSPSVPKPASPA